MKIRVLGNNDKAFVLGKLPDGEVVGLVEVNELDLCRTWINRFQFLQQPE